MSILIKNARILYENKLIRTNIFIDNGKIIKISTLHKTADKIIDIKNKVVLPGLIDAHTHFREPGLTHKEDFLTGSKAAVAGGVTTILDMPNTIPATTTREALEEKRELAKKSIVNYGFHFGATNNNLSELINAKNINSVKVYMGASTGNLVLNNIPSLQTLFKNWKKIITIHAEDEICLQEYKGKYPNKPEFHNKIRAKICAVKALKKALELAKKYKRHLHIAHITSKEEVELITNTKNNGIKLTCEVTPHHLFLNSNETKKQKNFVKVNPPLRDKSDVIALWKALTKDRIDIIASDHAPHTIEEKESPYELAPAGVPGLETMLPLLLDAYNKNKITLQRLVRLTSSNPARLFKIKNKGFLEKGYDADLVVVDLKAVKKVRNDMLFTKCGWSPFNGWKLKGWPVMSFVNGNLIYDNGMLSLGSKSRLLVGVKAREVDYYE